MHSELTPSTIPVWSRRFGSWNFSISRSPFQVKELKHHYDRAAELWQSKIENLGFPSAYERLFYLALNGSEQAQSDVPLKVLDAGIGTGAMSKALAETLAMPIDVLGVDISKEMLEQAHKNAQGTQINLRTLQADLAELPVPSDSFDLIVMAHVIEHLSDPLPILKEMQRVLKPGGLLIASMTCRSAFGRYIQLIWRTHQVTESSAIRWMEASGFDRSTVLPFDLNSSSGSRSMGYVARKPYSRDRLTAVTNQNPSLLKGVSTISVETF